MKCVVTGQSGFLGQHMARHLREKGHEVLDNPTGNLRNYENAVSAVKGAEIVFHFAADMGGVGYFSDAQYEPFVNNIQIDINTFQACREAGVKRLFYPSSACIFPKHLQTSAGLNEDQIIPANADQMYGWEKFVMTLLARHASLDVRVGILHTISGEGQTWTGKKAKFPPSIAYKALLATKTNEIEIWGDGSQTRTILHVQDAVEKIYEIVFADAYHGEVNISSDEVVTVQQSAEWCCQYLGIKPRFIYNLEKPSGVQFRGVDNSKFKRYYRHQNQIKTEMIFHRLIDWIRPQIS